MDCNLYDTYGVPTVNMGCFSLFFNTFTTSSPLKACTHFRDENMSGAFREGRGGSSGLSVFQSVVQLFLRWNSGPWNVEWFQSSYSNFYFFLSKPTKTPISHCWDGSPGKGTHRHCQQHEPNSWRLPSDLHTCVMAHTHTQNKWTSRSNLIPICSVLSEEKPIGVGAVWRDDQFPWIQRNIY